MAKMSKHFVIPQLDASVFVGTVDFDGHTLEIDQGVVDVSVIAEPDPGWTFTDASGHVHRYDSQVTDGPYPTLQYKIDHTHSDDQDCDEEDPCWGDLECRECGEKIRPGSRGPVHRTIPGLRTCMIDGEPVSPAAAQDFLDSARRESLAARPVLKCRRCEEPLSAGQGHVCSGMVAGPVTLAMVKNLREQGLNYVLAVLVGTDEARQMIRDAWVSRDEGN